MGKTCLLFISFAFGFGFISCNKPSPAPLPRANFFVENDGCNADCYLYFYDASDNAVSWQWRFGNGQNSNRQNDSSNYSLSGTYETWLIVANSDGVKDSVRKTIIIH